MRILYATSEFIINLITQTLASHVHNIIYTEYKQYGRQGADVPNSSMQFNSAVLDITA